ncbi:MAG: ABC transporter substrate-binding protein [Dehalococcoidia bacterium]
MTYRRWTRRMLLAGALGAALALTACGGQTSVDPPASTPDAIPGAVDVSNVPELQDGMLTVGSDISYAPMEFFEEGTETPAGLDIDLAKAIARKLGVQVEFENTGYEGLLAFVNSGEFDIVMSALTITEDRQKLADFVPYLLVGTGILVPAGNPDDINGLENLCGRTVTVVLGSIQSTLVSKLSDEQCDDPIDVVAFAKNPLAVQDLRTGGSDANLSDMPVASFDAEQSDGALEVVGTQIDPAPYGIVVRKGSPELKAAIEAAVAALMASNEYAEILADWGLESTALEPMASE